MASMEAGVAAALAALGAEAGGGVEKSEEASEAREAESSSSESEKSRSSRLCEPPMAAAAAVRVSARMEGECGNLKFGRGAEGSVGVEGRDLGEDEFF